MIEHGTGILFNVAKQEFEFGNDNESIEEMSVGKVLWGR